MVTEDARVEYKLSLSEWKEGAETLAAFATAQGGRLVFGIGPDGKRVGVTLGRNTLENLAADIKRHTDPPLFPAIEIEGEESDALLNGAALLFATDPQRWIVGSEVTGRGISSRQSH